MLRNAGLGATFSILIAGVGGAQTAHFPDLQWKEKETYYMEHTNEKRCRVYYIDFQEFYQKDGDADLVRGGALGPEAPRPRAIKALCKKDVRESLHKVCSAEILNVTPNLSGYIVALTCFLPSTDERVENHRRLVASARDEKELSKELEDADSFETDWYKYLETSKSK